MSNVSILWCSSPPPPLNCGRPLVTQLPHPTERENWQSMPSGRLISSTHTKNDGETTDYDLIPPYPQPKRRNKNKEAELGAFYGSNLNT